MAETQDKEQLKEFLKEQQQQNQQLLEQYQEQLKQAAKEQGDAKDTATQAAQPAQQTQTDQQESGGLWSWFRNSMLGRTFGIDDASRAGQESQGIGGWLRNSMLGRTFGMDDASRSGTKESRGIGGWLRNSWLGRQFGMDDASRAAKEGKQAPAQAQAQTQTQTQEAAKQAPAQEKTATKQAPAKGKGAPTAGKAQGGKPAKPQEGKGTQAAAKPQEGKGTQAAAPTQTVTAPRLGNGNDDITRIHVNDGAEQTAASNGQLTLGGGHQIRNTYASSGQLTLGGGAQNSDGMNIDLTGQVSKGTSNMFVAGQEISPPVTPGDRTDFSLDPKDKNELTLSDFENRPALKVNLGNNGLEGVERAVDDPSKISNGFDNSFRGIYNNFGNTGNC